MANFNHEHAVYCRPTDVELRLHDRGKDDYMGVINLQVTLTPKSLEERDQVWLIHSTSVRQQ